MFRVGLHTGGYGDYTESQRIEIRKNMEAIGELELSKDSGLYYHELIGFRVQDLRFRF